MLSKITWQEFISFLALVFAAYYLVVLLKYYRKEIRQLINGKQWNVNENKATNKIS
ncbi:MAG TPA: hypothetical protein VMT76_06920 [Puia sp.]|nr:hypothetical protein [Puia sp.]